jgi:hypothetical protein
MILRITYPDGRVWVADLTGWAVADISKFVSNLVELRDASIERVLA